MNNKQAGASLAEFLVAAPIVMLIGMATVQAALIYHGKTTLNYATFEAARTGAVNHAQVSVMRRELGERLAPVQGGDGSVEKAAMAVAQSLLEAERKDITQFEILNPTVEAFSDWGVHSQVTHHRVIPNSHLRHKNHDVGPASGLSLRDANLLKVKVTYGLNLKVPVVGKLFAMGMMAIDAENAHYYVRNKFPLTAVATVRMQSEVWEQEIVNARVSTAPPLETVPMDESGGDSDGQPTVGTRPLPDDISDAGEYANVDDHAESITDPTDATEEATADLSTDPATGLPVSDCEGGEHGLGAISQLIDTSDYVNQACPIENPAFNAPTSSESSTGSSGMGCV